MTGSMDKGARAFGKAVAKGAMRTGKIIEQKIEGKAKSKVTYKSSKSTRPVVKLKVSKDTTPKRSLYFQ